MDGSFFLSRCVANGAALARPLARPQVVVEDAMPKAKKNPHVFFDIAIGGRAAERITFEVGWLVEELVCSSMASCLPGVIV